MLLFVHAEMPLNKNTKKKKYLRRFFRFFCMVHHHRSYQCHTLYYILLFLVVFFRRQFNVVLREDPSSIFSSDVQIENTLGPLAYDVSRVYTGTLEGKTFCSPHSLVLLFSVIDWHFFSPFVCSLSGFLQVFTLVVAHIMQTDR